MLWPWTLIDVQPPWGNRIFVIRNIQPAKLVEAQKNEALGTENGCF